MPTRNHFVNFTVEGAGEFPLDMLRYDGCYPRTEEDANRAQDRERGRRQVECTKPMCPSYWRPKAARWESFGWKVIAEKRDTYA